MNEKAAALATTVTFLEMDARPANRAMLPLGVNAVVLHSDRPPLPFYRYLQFHVGFPWHWESRLRMDDETLAGRIHAETTDVFVLYLDGAPAGFFEIDRGDPDVTDLAYFGLMPHASGRGLGRWFLASAIDACWSNEPARITVNTCTLDHPAALPLYQKLGFRPYRRAPGNVVPLSKKDLHRLAEQGVTAA